jgi:hypothetical protein
VLRGDGWREAPDVAPVDRRDVAADGQDSGAVVGGEVELDDPGEAPAQRRVRAVALAEPETARRLGQVEGEAAGGPVEAVGDEADQEQGRRAEGGQPEPLRVRGPGVVAQRVDASPNT